MIKNWGDIQDGTVVFNKDYYLSQVKEDISPYKCTAIQHFFVKGWKKSYDPHPLFDINYYYKKYPVVKKQRINPWLHYLNFGTSERRNPCLLFDSNYYLTQNKLRLRNLDPLSHFINKGWKERMSPSPYFDTRYYLSQKPNLKFYQDPLSHFLKIGWKEGKNPHPFFDTQYYLSQVPALNKFGINPLVHYVSEGMNKFINPHPLIDVKYNLQTNPYLFFYNKELITHFASTKAQGHYHPIIDSEYVKLTLGKEVKSVLFNYLKAEIKSSPTPYFDTQYYLSQNPDLTNIKDPLFHYLTVGWRENKNPSQYFDTKHYLNQTQQPIEKIDNPLSHFYKSGKSKGLSTYRSLENSNSEVMPESIDNSKKLLFMHIPKTAGMSLNLYVKSQLKNKLYTFERNNVVSFEERAYQDALRKYSANIKAVFGHFEFGFHHIFPQKCSYITFIRNPVERIISLYLFQKADPYSNLVRLGIEDKSLQEILENGLSPEYDNRMIYSFSGAPYPLSQSSHPELIECALRNIREHFAFVGICEKMKESCDLLSEGLNWKPQKLKHVNVGNSERKNKMLKNKKLVQLIESTQHLDIELYNKLSHQPYTNF